MIRHHDEVGRGGNMGTFWWMNMDLLDGLEERHQPWRWLCLMPFIHSSVTWDATIKIQLILKIRSTLRQWTTIADEKLC